MAFAKVNVDTDLRLAATGSVRRFLAENPAEFDPRKFLKGSAGGHVRCVREAL